MKYIINETQKEKLNQKIMSFIDKSLGYQKGDYILLDHNYGQILFEDVEERPYVHIIKFVHDDLEHSPEYEDNFMTIYVPSKETPRNDDPEYPMVFLKPYFYELFNDTFSNLWIEPFKQWVYENFPELNELGLMGEMDDKSIKSIDDMWW